MYSDIVQHIALAVAATFCIGVVIYVAASFAIMRAHTTERPLRAAIREALREAMWALLTQPLLPLYYVVGRRMGGGERGVPVILVHGYTQNRVDFLRIARVLTRAGAGPLYGFNYPWFARVDRNAERLARFVDQVCRERGAEQVDLVCHSLGGVVAMEMLRSGLETRVRRCVTIASPLAGVVWRGPIVGACGSQLRKECEFLRAHAGHVVPVPCLSIYSTHDNVVHPPVTSSLARRGGRDHVVDGLSHLAILFSPEVADTVAEFVRAGELSVANDAAPAELQATA